MNISNVYKVLGTAVVLGQLAVGPIVSHADTVVPSKQIQNFNKVTNTSQKAPNNIDLSGIEEKHDARLGVFALDTGTNQMITYNGDDRFAYASTHKALAVGALLQTKSLADLDQIITYTQKDLDQGVYHPITEKHVNTGMTLRDLCDAALRYSDNTAENLIFKQLGGPSGLEKALRGIGDTVTNPKRIETELNVVNILKGETQDTSTPKAMATSLQAFTLGNALPEEKRTLLVDWMKRNTTGDEAIRFGVPEGWEVADKTGNGSYGTRNDIAVIWPKNGKPIILAVMSDRNSKKAIDSGGASENATSTNELIADATKEVMKALKGSVAKFSNRS
ncbi:class A beta-lactamase [Bacillus thuringiensis serovar yunnanensis]|nr:class A beta-lactamase [Bacillus thuringiensis serovar yunnanensis]